MLKTTALSTLAMGVVIAATYFLLAHYSGHKSVLESIVLGLCAFAGGLVGGLILYAVRRSRGR